MSDSDGAGCAIIIGILCVVPFIIAACPILLGILAGFVLYGLWRLAWAILEAWFS